MKIQTIYYERCQGLPNYSNLKVGITVQIEESESPDEAFERAGFLSGERLDQPRGEKGDYYGTEEYEDFTERIKR